VPHVVRVYVELTPLATVKYEVDWESGYLRWCVRS
jgi:hypothetical protein